MVRVLKIGGSILTDKNKMQCARHEEISRVAEEIASASRDLVLVHGAGSFGHIPAKKYGLPVQFSAEGIRVTHQSVAELNRLLVEALSKAGANAMPVHPFSCILLRDGRIERFEMDFIRKMIEEDLLPVLHGDVAMDLSRKVGIVSGDQLVPYLGRALRAEIVAVGTNVDGVLFQGSSLPQITREDLFKIKDSLREGSGVDVTGGMKAKLLELLELADEGTSSVIFNAAKKGQIIKVLQGQELGTKVRSKR